MSVLMYTGVSCPWETTPVLRAVVQSATHPVCLPCGPLHLDRYKRLYHSWLTCDQSSCLGQTGPVLRCMILKSVGLCRGYMCNKINSKLFHRFSWNSCMFSNMFIVAEIILKQKLRTPSAAEITFVSVSDVVTCELKHWNNFKIISK